MGRVCEPAGLFLSCLRITFNRLKQNCHFFCVNHPTAAFLKVDLMAAAVCTPSTVALERTYN